MSRADLIVVRDTGQHHVDTSRLGERIANERREVVLAAQNQQRREIAGGAHTLDNLGLSAGDVLAAAQDTDVGGTDLAHDGKIGVGGLGQALNLVKWFMPISSTRTSVSAGAESTVSGMPIRLLKLPFVAQTR